MINELLGKSQYLYLIPTNISANGDPSQSIYYYYNSYLKQMVYIATAHLVTVLCALCTELCSQTSRSINK